MKFTGIEHYDIFPDDVVIFWADISNPPQNIQTMAREIDGADFSSDHFGVCVNYIFETKEFCFVTDSGAPLEDCRNVFYIDQKGDKHWFEMDIPKELSEQIFKECGKIVHEQEKLQRKPRQTHKRQSRQER